MDLRFKVEKRPPAPMWLKVTAPVISVVAALAICSAFILQAGVNPLYGYYHLFVGALGSTLGLSETFVRFSPLLFTGVAVALAFTAKFWNIGAEGQLYAGGLAATFFGVSFIGAPSALIIPLMFVSGFLGGALWAVIPALLKTKLKVDEVVTTLMGNWIMWYFTSYLLTGPWKNPVTVWPESAAIAPTAEFPILVPGTRIHLGIPVALFCAFIYFLIHARSSWGYELKAIGANPKASNLMGINVTRGLVTVAILSGGIAGLAGVSELGGIHHHMKTDLSFGFGYTGIVIAMLGGLHPIGVTAAAFFMSVISTGSQVMYRVTGVPYPISEIIQGMTLACLLLGVFFTEYRIRRKKE